MDLNKQQKMQTVDNCQNINYIYANSTNDIM